MKGDDDKAFQAGCDGYITKPIETLTLATRVREYLSIRSTPPPPPVEVVVEAPKTFPEGIILSAPELEGVRRRFLEEGMLQSRQLLEGLERTFDKERAIRTAHAWVDAAHVLGYSALAILAADAEKLLKSPAADDSQLCDALSNVMVAFVEPPEAGMGPVPDAITKILKGKSVALVGCSEDVADRMCNALERASAKPRLFEAASDPDTEAISTCGAVIVDVRPETLGSPWLLPANLAQLLQPLLLIGMRDEILRLHPDVIPRASDLLIDGWQPEEALLRLSHAVARATLIKTATIPLPAPLDERNGGSARPREFIRDAEVLLADDDMTVRMVVRSAIQGAGIKCRMACNGTEALQMIRDCRPPAAVLDINMPGMDGYEVLAAVRNEGLPVRIILLTARQQEADITRGFTLGADDYIVKPFNPAELLARLKRFLWQ